MTGGDGLDDRRQNKDVDVHGEGEEQVPLELDEPADHPRQAGCGCLGPSALPAKGRSTQ